MAASHPEIQCSALGEAVVAAATVIEEISRPTRAVVTLEVESPVAPDDLLGKSAVITSGGAKHPRKYALVITEVEQPDLDGGASRYVLTLEHPLALLRYRRDHRTFLDQSIKQIIDVVIAPLKALNLTATWNATRAETKRVACVQHGETDYDFVQRLLAEEGIFWLSPDGDEPAFELDDEAAAFTDIAGTPEVAFEGENVEGGIVEISYAHVVTPGAVSLIDYDFEKPGLDLTARMTIDDDAAGEHFEYPGGYTTPDDGKAYARIRAEYIASTKVTVEGSASRPDFRAGATFEITSSHEGAPSGELLLKRVEHSFAGRYRNRFLAQPAPLPYRPARVVSPNIGGTLSATVTGPAGSPEQAIHTDKFGRLTFLHAFDRIRAPDDKSSQWIRLTQPMVGGSMMLARVGWEIALRHLDGNPDRPIAIARMFDGTHPPPETLPAGKTKTSFGTLSSPGAKKTNAIVIDDANGSMLLAVTAAKDLDATVLNDETESVGANDTLAVGKDNTVLIGDGQVTTIEKDETVTAAKDAGVEIAGDRTKKITKDETATALGGVSIRIDGDDEETVGKDLKITADEGFLETAKGKYDLSVTGAVTAKSKKDSTIWVGGKSSETIGAAKTVQSSDGAIAEAVKGDANLTVGGAWTETVDGNRRSSAMGASEKTIGAAGTLTATGKLQIKAKTIKITVSGAATFVGGGGTLSLSPASVALVGVITLKGSSGVEVAGAPQLAG